MLTDFQNLYTTDSLVNTQQNHSLIIPPRLKRVAALPSKT